jgi:hypothetical protein
MTRRLELSLQGVWQKVCDQPSAGPANLIQTLRGGGATLEFGTIFAIILCFLKRVAHERQVPGQR